MDVNLRIEIINESFGKVVKHIPAVQDKVTIEWTRKGSPGLLRFKVLKTEKLDFDNGDVVTVWLDNKMIFSGRIFEKSRNDTDFIDVKAYDGLRYFKNKNTIVYRKKSAELLHAETLGSLIKWLAKRYKYEAGNFENFSDSKYTLKPRVEWIVPEFDIIQNATDETLRNTGELFVMYMEVVEKDGAFLERIALKKLGSDDMKLAVMIDSSSGEGFSYVSSIDDQTYNSIVLLYKDEEQGQVISVSRPGAENASPNVKLWGLLQYQDELSANDSDPQLKADKLYELYNMVGRRLTLSKVFGDIKMRPGFTVMVNLNDMIGDITLPKNYPMMIEKVKHTFELNHHYADLTLRDGGGAGGGIFNA